MTTGVLIGLVFVAVIVPALLRRPIKYPTSESHQYQPKHPFLRHDETELYHRLRQTLRFATVFPQVAMAAIVTEKGRNRVARNAFDRKYVDYLICDHLSLKPLYVIELDGASHRSKEAQKRDATKDRVFHSAGIPVVRYTEKDISSHIILRDYLRITGAPAETAADANSPSLPQTAAVIQIDKKRG